MSKYFLFLCFVGFLRISALFSMEKQIDEFDKIAIDFSLLSFHSYDESLAQTSKIWNDSNLENMKKGWKIDSFVREHTKGQIPCIMGIIGYNEIQNILIISYRGSEQWSEYLYSFYPLRIPVERTNLEIFNLHAGFVNAFEYSKNSLFDVINKFLFSEPFLNDEKRQDKMRVIFTGHSLGGSTATVSAFYCRAQDRFKNIHLRIFGSPAVGPIEFNRWICENLDTVKTFFRQTDNAVYFLPSTYGLCHAGQLVSLPSFGDYSVLYPMAHDIRKYQRGIYEALNIAYSPAFSIFFGVYYGFRIEF